MFKKMSTEFKVGSTIIISTLILIFGIIWGKGYRLHTNKYQINVLFENVGGMIPGDPVTVNGVKEGKVVDIGWYNRYVMCTLELNDRIQLYEDAVFTVISAELLAGMKVEIYPGKSAKHINLSQQPFRGTYGGRIVDVGMVIGELAGDVSALSFRIDSTISMINLLLKSGNLQANLSESLANIKDLSTDFRPLPAQFRNTLNGLDTTLYSVNQLLRRNDQNVGEMVGNLNAVSGRLDTVVTSMKVLLAKVENREGTLGKMVYDTTLYSQMNRALISIDSLARQIKEEGLELDLF